MWCNNNNKTIGGAPLISRLMARFQDTLQNCGLMDVGFSGPPYTWSWHDVKERLDRGVWNASWRLLFLEAIITHLPSFCSDHMALLLDTHPSIQHHFSKPFRFLASWLEDPSFKDLVAGAWGEGQNWLASVNLFRNLATNWNHNSFGSSGMSINPFLFRRKRIGTIKLNIYKDPQDCVRWQGINRFSKLPQNVLDSVPVCPTDMEIHKAVCDMGAWKAPGPDDLHPLFLQSQWDVIGNSVCTLIKEIIFPSKGDKPNKKAWHKVAWEEFNVPKHLGGWGFKNLYSFNKAMIMKLSWGLIHEPNVLWVRVLRSKYRCGFNYIPTVTPRLSA
ncbi:Endonuclease/exonuclease/phosphatase superfamily [Sesbania bispinosa]|nr:Endonuclease/exonuclease/phosphatase superfamily [Sesbania bispinosa]